MSLQRSPIKSNTNQTSNSFPDLSKISSDSENTLTNITQRKRKEPCFELEIKNEIQTFRNEIMTFLKEFCDKQTNTLSSLCEDMNTVKIKLDNVTTNHEKLLVEHDKLKIKLNDIHQNTVENTDTITNLKTEISQIQTKLNTFSSALPNSETHSNIVQEIEERMSRAKNIIIRGITESNHNSLEARLEHDRCEVSRMLKLIDKDCPKPIKIIRLGKHNQSISRPIKAMFESQEIAKRILRSNINRDNTTLKIASDQTPLQMEYLRRLRDELIKRQQAGETGIVIKYIRGVPKIVKNITKN